MRSAVEKLIKEKAVILTQGDKNFLEELEKTNKIIFSEIIKILNSLETNADGTLKRSQLNRKLLGQLTKKIMKAVTNTALPKKVNGFLNNFDKIDKLNQGIYSGLLDRNLSKSVTTSIGVLSLAKKQTVIDSILGEAALNANFINPIRDILLNGIATQSKVTDLTKSIRNFVKGKEGSSGTLTRYARQIALDSLNQNDGAISDLIRDNYKLDAFYYINPLVANSRENCQDLVNSEGIFQDLAIAKGAYLVKDIPTILRRARKGKNSGFNDSVTPENFAQIRMGWQCNHQVIYFNSKDL